MSTRGKLPSACCEGLRPSTPRDHDNPPGRSSLDYRVGTHADFKASQHVGLGRHAALRRLTARDGADPTLALVDAWAVALDVLSFYQERIANEGYLGTATERRSVLELARAIGYELRPGVAASTHLAYTLADAPGSPLEALVPAGAKVQSVPAQDGLPQVYETTEPLRARAEWNALRPVATRWRPLRTGDEVVHLAGTGNNLATGDRLLVVGAERLGDPASPRWDAPRIASVALDRTRDLTRVRLARALDLGAGGEADCRADAGGALYVPGARAAVFGHSAPDWRSLPDAMKRTYLGCADVDVDCLADADRGEWPQFVIHAPADDAGGPPARSALEIALSPTPGGVADAARNGAETIARGFEAAAETAVPRASNAAAKAANQTLAAGVTIARELIAAGVSVAGEIGTADASVPARTVVAKLLEALSGLLTFAGPSVSDAELAALRDILKDTFKLPTFEAPTDRIDAAIRFVVKTIRERTPGAADTTVLGDLGAAFGNLVAALQPFLVLPGLVAHLSEASAQQTIANALAGVLGPGGAVTAAVDAADRAARDLAEGAVARQAVNLVEAAVEAALDRDPLPAGAADRVTYVADQAKQATRLVVDIVTGTVDAQSIQGAGVAIRAPGAIAPALSIHFASSLAGGLPELGQRLEGAVNAAVDRAVHPKAWVQRRTDAVLSTDRIDLDTTYPAVTPGSWVVLADGGDGKAEMRLFRARAVAETARTAFSLTGKVSRLTLDGPDLDRFRAAVRSVVVFAAPRALACAPEPLNPDALLDGDVLALDGEHPGLERGRLLAVTGSDADGDPRSEIVAVRRITVSGGTTDVHLEPGLAGRYRRASLRVHANVVRASHGEARAEVHAIPPAAGFASLGLVQAPLTHVAAPTARGAASTLDVRVDGVRWHEVPSLEPAGPGDAVFTTRIDDDGRVRLGFGDGRDGMSPPPGPDRVEVRYRTGIGRSGLAARGALTTLLTRPLGVSTVINPVPATGAADPESRDSARSNAPLSARTLDRVVSVSDVEDLARAFAGIGQACARELWTRRGRIVHLTVADAFGAPVERGTDLYRALAAAIDGARHADRPVVVDTYAPVTFRLKARLAVDPRFARDDVHAAAAAALHERFGPGRLAFGQPLFQSDLLVALQQVPGVAAADLDRLHRTDDAVALAAALDAAPARADGASVLRAELLSVDGDGIELTDLAP